MARNSELRKRICEVFVEGEGLYPKDIIERVCTTNEDISPKQVHNFIGNNVKSGILYKDNEGKYYWAPKDKRMEEFEVENSMLNSFKMEVEEICLKYMKRLENPFDKFEGESLLAAKKVYIIIKRIRKIICEK